MRKTRLGLAVALMLLISMSITAFAEGETGRIVSSAHGSTYVIKNDGTLWGWGYSYTGNGNGHKEAQIEPVQILEGVKAVSANSFGGIAVKKDGSLWAWGKQEGYPIANGGVNPLYLRPEKIMEDVKLASMGRSSMAVIKNDGSLWLCGDVYIGDGTDTQANGSAGFVKVMDDVMDVYNSWKTIYVIKDDSTLWGWGENSGGELGNMSLEDTLEPVKILDDVKMVRNFSKTAFAIRTDNSLYSWGHGVSDGIYTENGWIEDAALPYKVMDNVLDVTACKGGAGVLVVKADHTLWGWNNQWHDEGDKMEPFKYADQVGYVSNGERHAAIVMKDNTLWTMGGNYRKGLGYDSDETWYTPQTKIVDNVQDAPASWAVDEVEKAIGAQLIPAEMQGDYTKAITREEFCILAIRMIEVKADKSIEAYMEEVGAVIAPRGTFEDCDTKEVRESKALGIAKGTSDTTFEPDLILNRETAAVFLTRTAQACGRDTKLSTPSYTDVEEISDWAKDYTGYVYDIGVIKGTSGGKFEPKASYQRQQAFMTMYRIWNAIDTVNPSNVKLPEVTVKETEKATTPAISETGLSVAELKVAVSTQKTPSEFSMIIEGTSIDKDSTQTLKYDTYFKDANVRIDTYWNEKKITKAIYNTKTNKTTTENMAYTNYAETIDGNMLPIRLLNITFIEELEAIKDGGTFTANYQTLNGEKVLYIKSSFVTGITMEYWYSLKYIAPIKYREVRLLEDESKSEINWTVVSSNTSPVDGALFESNADGSISDAAASDYIEGKVSGDTRTLLLYEVKKIANDEAGIEGMMHQVLYYSDASYDLLVAYFKDLLKDTKDYSVYVQEGRTSIDGTLNGKLVIVIVNDYLTTKPTIGMNGVNVNYYE